LIETLLEKLEEDEALAELISELNCELLFWLDCAKLLLLLDWLMLWLFEAEALDELKFTEELFDAELLKLL
jgi:hypothetical protein